MTPRRPSPARPGTRPGPRTGGRAAARTAVRPRSGERTTTNTTKEPAATAPGPASPSDPESAAYQQTWLNLGTYHHQNGDDRAARRCYRRALAAGEARARLALGTLLSEGQGGPRDEGEALRLYEAGGNEPWALLGLGTLYAEGRGVARDDAEARRCFERAGASPDEDVQAAVAEALAELARRESPPADS